MSEDSQKPIFKNDILNILVGSLIGIIPGIILWFVMTYLQSVAGIVGFFITAGALISYKFFAKKVKPSGIAICILVSVICVFTLDTCISAYTLYKEYSEKVSTEEVEKTRTEFVEEYSKSDSLDQFLKKYEIRDLNDTEKLDKFIEDSINEAFKKTYCIETLPTSYSDSFSSLHETLSHNRTLKISRYFIANLITSLSFSFLSFVMVTNARFFNVNNLEFFDDDE